MKKNWKKVLVGTLCLVGFLLLLVKGNQFEKVSLISTEGQSYEKAVVTKITKDNLEEDGNRYGTQEVRVQVKSGAYAGEEFDAVNPSGSLFGMENCEVGSRVIVILSTLLTLWLLGGVSKKTVSAVVGTVSGVVVAAAAAVVFGKAAGITGYNVSDIETLNYVAQNTQIKIGQLLFSGIIIAALGATMDVGMSIASTIQELHERSPQLGTKELFVSGIRVGRDMMGTMANTLIFAYVGGSLSTLVVNYAYNLSYNQLINSYVIGTEIMQGLSGTLGVVLTVPITAAVAAVLIGKKTIVKEPLMQDIYDGSDDYEEPETDGEYGEDV